MSAKNFEIPATFPRISKTEASMLYPWADIEADDLYCTLKTTGILRKPFAHEEQQASIEIALPRNTIPGSSEGIWWPFTITGSIARPYGTELTERIAYAIFQDDLYKHPYGIVPGYYRWYDNIFRFTAEYNPIKAEAETVMLFSDVSMKGYAGVNNLIAVKVGDMYGLILPLNFLVEPHHAMTGWQTANLKEEMTKNLATYLQRNTAG